MIKSQKESLWVRLYGRLGVDNSAIGISVVWVVVVDWSRALLDAIQEEDDQITGSSMYRSKVTHVPGGPVGNPRSKPSKKTVAIPAAK